MHNYARRSEFSYKINSYQSVCYNRHVVYGIPILDHYFNNITISKENDNLNIYTTWYTYVSKVKMPATTKLFPFWLYWNNFSRFWRLSWFFFPFRILTQNTYKIISSFKIIQFVQSQKFQYSLWVLTGILYERRSVERGSSKLGTVNSSIKACLVFNFWTFGAVLYSSFWQFLLNKSPNFQSSIQESLLFETVFYWRVYGI